MKYFFQSMLGAMLLLSGVFSFSSCGNDESDPDSTVTIAMATVEKQPQYDAPYLVLDNGEKLWVVGFEGRRTDFWKLFFFGSR